MVSPANIFYLYQLWSFIFYLVYISYQPMVKEQFAVIFHVCIEVIVC